MKQAQPANLILYGPPGTGKTHATAEEAVRLCLGGDTEALRSGRAALMREYRRLQAEGRIAFVTFHQSVSYEEFVEGLRPETGAAEDQELAGSSGGPAGFRLKVEGGIFKRFSERAQKSTGQVTEQRIRLEGRTVWKMSLGAVADPEQAPVFEEAIAENAAIFGFFPIDFTAAEYSDIGAIQSAAESCAKDQDLPFKLPAAVGMTDAFRNRLRQGDILLVTKGNKLIRAIGEVTGAYEYHPRGGSNDYLHRRRTRWLWVDEDGLPASDFYQRQLVQRTLYPLEPGLLNTALVERLMNARRPGEAAEPEPHVLIIDEINRANISKVFGELITLLEPDKRIGQDNELRLTLPYSKELFGVPSNLHVIGTMNTADRSIALLDTALRRRFRFRELMPRPELLPASVDGIDLQKLLARINERIEYPFDREHQIGHAYFMGCAARSDVEAVMRDAVIPLLAEYFYDDWQKIAMVLEGRPVSGGSGFEGRFLRARRPVPQGFGDEAEDGTARLRWSVRDRFDFSEFAAG